MIELDHVFFSYGDKPVLRDFSCRLASPGAYAMLGPSGCGKTTLLFLLAGLLAPQSGRILHASESRIALCFQEDRLLPWRTALENVALAAPDAQRVDRLARARMQLERVGLAGEAQAFPAALSGGMKRRVALARALAYDAPVLLLDEPFRALDEDAHAAMRRLVLEQARGKLLVLVTHDPRDAEGMQKIHLHARSEDGVKGRSPLAGLGGSPTQSPS